MKRILVIGGSSGIGRASVLKLLEKGHSVYSTHCNSVEFSNAGSDSTRYLNVLDEEQDVDFLPDTIDGLVYTPGSIDLRPFEKNTTEDFIADYQLQLIGFVKVLKQVLPRLKKSTQASVVLFSTVAVQKGFPYHALVASSKGAIEGLTRSLAAEYAPRIRVNCIAPSLTNTPMASHLLSSEKRRKLHEAKHPLQRIGEADDIANMVSFLLSDESSWITGQVMHVDGGISCLTN